MRRDKLCLDNYSQSGTQFGENAKEGKIIFSWGEPKMFPLGLRLPSGLKESESGWQAI